MSTRRMGTWDLQAGVLRRDNTAHGDTRWAEQPRMGTAAVAEHNHTVHKDTEEEEWLAGAELAPEVEAGLVQRLL